MVECGGLENRCTARYRGFESLFLRLRSPKSDQREDEGELFFYIYVKGKPMSFLARRATADEVRTVPMFHVYILLCNDGTHYTGCTNDLEDRIHRHNKGNVSYTSKRLPVLLLFHATFPDKYKAYAFEKYLKSGSGRAFAKRHLL